MLQRNADFQHQRHSLLKWQRPFPLDPHRVRRRGAVDINPARHVTPLFGSPQRSVVTRRHPAIVLSQIVALLPGDGSVIFPSIFLAKPQISVTGTPFEIALDSSVDSLGDNYVGTSCRSIDVATRHGRRGPYRSAIAADFVDPTLAEAGAAGDHGDQGEAHSADPAPREAAIVRREAVTYRHSAVTYRYETRR
jgi:hypothetical protein